jgi:hypothetical protein
MCSNVPFPEQRVWKLACAIDRAHSETRSIFRNRERPIRSWPIPAVYNCVHRAAVLGTPLDDPRVFHPRLATRLPRYCLLEPAATQLSQRYALTSGCRPRLRIQVRAHRYLRPNHVITLSRGDNTVHLRAGARCIPPVRPTLWRSVAARKRRPCNACMGSAAGSSGSLVHL